jgi:hypothetical protein
MIAADAYLWARFREDNALQQSLINITQNMHKSVQVSYGTIGEQCIIKNSQVIKDVNTGNNCIISGAGRLENLTVNSSEREPTHIGEGVELIDGIVGYGCKITSGSIAHSFVMGNHSALNYAARMINTVLGDNATVSCCEIQNNLIFPAHEQHHNNSFLIASLVMGQSNIAAGATIGSNHNSRANDNEIEAGRGFWPGLCTSLKHSGRFASFVLLAKADFPSELNIPFPFALVNNNVFSDRLEIMPAYWWLYNMYALARNSQKFQNRDHRKIAVQHIEFEPFAPDTIEEVYKAIRLLELWTAKAALKSEGNTELPEKDELIATGNRLLNGSYNAVKNFEVTGENIENSQRKILILKPYQAYHAYLDIMHYYAVTNLLKYLLSNNGATLTTMHDELNGKRENTWYNLGGQLIQGKDVDVLCREIKSGKINDWEKIHSRYDSLCDQYAKDKQKHAYTVLCDLSGTNKITPKLWEQSLKKLLKIQQYVCDQVFVSRKKDYENPFRKSTYRNEEEMKAVTGPLEDNLFINQVKQETDDLKKLIEVFKKH